MAALAATLRRLELPKTGRVWLAVLAILAAVALLDPAQFRPSVSFTLGALANTLPFIAFAVLAVAVLKATGADALVARAFVGRESRMIVLAALVGGLAPFCSCEVIPFIAALLALGTPVSAVMAFWLSSPLIDPAAFLITAGALGWPFAIGKTAAAVGVGLLGGFAMQAAARAGFFANPVRPRDSGGCCGAPSAFGGAPEWRFWGHADRRRVFADETKANALFLLKWLTLAYLLESLMLAWLPAEAIAGAVGGEGLLPIVVAALVGAPAYLNGYAAPALVAGLVEQGMSNGAGMAFMVAGAVSCIPAMTAVYALVRRPVFAAYVGLGFAGAVLSGIVFGVLFPTL
ncbi:MAG: permease [Alphaproteobacteria bacterium]|nr:permease [Alphaproteobacteria bacterium]